MRRPSRARSLWRESESQPIRPASILSASSRMSPQAGFSTRTCASASGSSPELRGRSKWSRSWGEYMAKRTKHSQLIAVGATGHLPKRVSEAGAVPEGTRIYSALNPALRLRLRAGLDSIAPMALDFAHPVRYKCRVSFLGTTRSDSVFSRVGSRRCGISSKLRSTARASVSVLATMQIRFARLRATRTTP